MQSIDDLDSYKTSQANRWEPIENPIIGKEALLRMALTTTTANTQSHIYKALTLSSGGTYSHSKEAPITILLIFYFVNCFLVLTLASETLWQAPHR